MAQKTYIDGTAYEVKAGKCMVDGTGYDIKKGRTLIGGTGYDVAVGGSTALLSLAQKGSVDTSIVVKGVIYSGNQSGIEVSPGDIVALPVQGADDNTNLGWVTIDDTVVDTAETEYHYYGWTVPAGVSEIRIQVQGWDRATRTAVCTTSDGIFFTVEEYGSYYYALCTAVEGMIWKEWTASKRNPGIFESYPDQGIVQIWGDCAVTLVHDDESTAVDPSDVIIADHAYGDCA